MAEQLKTTVFLDGPFVFLEGPRWKDGHLWFSDMMAGVVWRAGADGSLERVVEVPNRPSGLGFLPDGTALVVSMRDRTLYRVERGALAVHADLSELTGGDINDMLVDDEGFAYVGNFGFDYWTRGTPPVAANIVLVPPDGTGARPVAEGLHFPNGMAATSDGRLVVAESHADRITSFAIANDRSLSDRKLFADLPGTGPDGIDIDAEDGVWVAAATGHRFMRVEAGGAITHEIDVSPRLAVACAIGGDDADTLYCLTTEPSWRAVGEGRSTSRIETAPLR